MAKWLRYIPFLSLPLTGMLMGWGWRSYRQNRPFAYPYAPVASNKHKAHRDTLAQVIRSLGATPVSPKSEYLDTVKPYIDRGEGNLDSDVNIAKLALALEVDAAIAYAKEAAQLKTPALITAGASIGANESAHATLIRSAFKSLGVDLKVIPGPLITPENRSSWIVKV